MQRKPEYVGIFVRLKPLTAVRRLCTTECGHPPPSASSLRLWHQEIQVRGTVGHRVRYARSGISVAYAAKTQNAFQYNPIKSLSSIDDPRIFVAAGKNCKVYADVDLYYTRVQGLATVPSTAARPSFIRQSELRDGFRTSISAGPLRNVHDGNKNPLRMLGTVRKLAHFEHKKGAVNFVVRETLAAAARLGAEFCDQNDRSIRPKQNLVKLPSGDVMLIVAEPKGRTRDHLPLPDGLTYPDGSPRLSPFVRVVECETVLATLPAQSQT